MFSKVKSIINKLRQSYWLKSGTLVLVTRLSLMGMGFISFLVLIRYFDKEHYGIWVIFMTISSLIETARIGFLKSPLMVLHSERTTKKDLLYANSLIINLITTSGIIIIVISIISMWGVFYEIGIIRNLFFLYFLKLAIISFSDHVDLVQETNLQFKGSFMDMFARYFVFLSLLLLSILIQYDLTLATNYWKYCRIYAHIFCVSCKAHRSIFNVSIQSVVHQSIFQIE